MANLAFTVPLSVSYRHPRTTSRCVRRSPGPVLAVMSGEAVQANAADSVPVSVNVVSDADVSRSAIQTAEDIDEILALAQEFDLRDLRIVDHGVEVEITRAGGRGFEDGKLAPPAVVEVASQAVTEEITQAEDPDVFQSDEEQVEPTDAIEPAREDKDPDTIYESDFVVTSNRVGFFFSGAKGKPPLANVGDEVGFNKPICIIEQLGQQYVYLSEASGTVLKIFVEDGDSVEYGQPVMVIRPD